MERFVTGKLAKSDAALRTRGFPTLANMMTALGLMAAGVVLTGAPGMALAQSQVQAQPGQAMTAQDAERQLLEKTNAATQALIDNRLDEAMRLFDEIIATNARAPQLMAAAHYHRGIIYQKRGAFNEAASDYTTALWLDALPDNMRARTHYNRGTALDNLGQQDRAKADFDAAIALMPEMAPAYNNRANVLRRMGEYEAAIADYDTSIALGNPLPHLPHYGRAAAREALGDIEGARADLEQAVSLAPDYAPAQTALADLPEAPSALTVAATPQAVTAEPVAIPPVASTPVASRAETAVTPVETAMLPAPVTPVKPLAAANDAPRGPAVPGQVPTSGQLATAPRMPFAQQPGVAATTAPESGQQRVTTASTAAATPAQVSGRWTTTILPAGSNQAIRLDDAGPALALKANEETQLAAMASPVTAPAAASMGLQPKKGLAFPGVPAEAYRSAAAEPARSAPVRQAPVRQATSAGAGSGYAVQLGSFRSETEAEAAWQAATRRLGTALQDRDHLVQRADIPGKGVYYRLRVGPMSAKTAASALCSTLKSQGQDCYVSKL
ncbi:SPOR domain-containing protein [Pyruvatibacter mobilis]|uniref:SPOR domain-containing protein n=1 Tax=Pyruvatibacter mobilis TaxID=1712261 RepID=UPI003BA9FE5E